jgi:hypothetical protein
MGTENPEIALARNNILNRLSWNVNFRTGLWRSLSEASSRIKSISPKVNPVTSIIHAEDQKRIIEDWLPRAKAAGLKAAAAKVPFSFFGKLSIGIVQSRLAQENRDQGVSNHSLGPHVFADLPRVKDSVVVRRSGSQFGPTTHMSGSPEWY